MATSPPFEKSLNSTDEDFIKNRMTTGPSGSKKLRGKKGAASDAKVYGETNGQLGQERGNTFWAAAKLILLQCHQVLKDDGHAIFVLKDYVSKGTRVPFSYNWIKLCEACGFRLVCRHRAMLVKKWKQPSLDGPVEVSKSRKGFFRRIYEQKLDKGDAKIIDWEDVACFVKVGANQERERVE